MFNLHDQRKHNQSTHNYGIIVFILQFGQEE